MEVLLLRCSRPNWMTTNLRLNLSETHGLLAITLLIGSPGLTSVGRSVTLLLAFVKAIILGFSLLKIHDQDFCSLLDIYVFRNRTFSSTREGSVFVRRRYVRCFSTSISALSRRPGHYGLRAPFVTALY
jgi:hypothetical protein